MIGLMLFPTFASPGRAEENVAPALALSHFTPETVDDILFNPRMGMYMASPPLEPQDDEWYLDVCDIAYYREHWADLNPEEGVYTFDEYFDPIFEYWVTQRGKRVAFGPMSQSKHGRTEYVTPKWVFDKGVPSVEHVGLYVDHQVDPVFWDKKYLDLYCEFIAKLGEYLDGREGFEFIDMRGIGEWGEMHLQRWTPEQLETTGYTDTKYIGAYRRMIDAHAKAFPESQVFLNVGGQKFLSIMDYAAQRGCHFRQDGMKPSGASADVGGWLYGPYSRCGVVCNFEFHSGYRSMQEKGWSLPETIDAGLRAPVSYWNTNLCRLSDAPEEVREQISRAARSIGYRFVLAGLDYQSEIHLSGDRPSRMVLFSDWKNNGVAPCYENFALEWSLVNGAGETVASALQFPETPTTHWWPGEEVRVATLLRVPAGTPPGDYGLNVAMALPETGERILLGIAGRSERDCYDLCAVRGVQGEGHTGVAFEEGFEDESLPWSKAGEMAANVDDKAAHSGKRSLVIAGLHPKGWNYASLRLPMPLHPAARYHLSAWMLVEEMQPDSHAPYIKFAANDAEDDWIANFTSQRYDMSRMGEWQLMDVYGDVPLHAAIGYLAIEKGASSIPITARIRLDDIKLELLEAP